jgi:hypothetical protein
MKAVLDNVSDGVLSFVFASAFAIGALLSVSCGSMPGDAIGSSRSSAALSTPQQATGAGHMLEGVHRTFSFGAVRQPDGRVAGEAQLFNHASGFESHAQIICMTVTGNRARMGGIIDHSDVRECEGSNMFFEVEDNGEGRQRQTDRSSFAGVCDAFGAAAVALVVAWCETGAAPYDVGLVPIMDGNIQVHE